MSTTTMSAPTLEGLTEWEQHALNAMWQRLHSKAAKNDLLDVYYDGHRAFRDLGISIPPQMRNIRAALGWPQKAVSALARKHQFEGFTLDGELDPYGVAETLEKSSFASELSMAITSAYKHGCAFLTVLPGDTSVGEPDVMIQARSARWTTGLFDQRTRTLSAALAVSRVEAQATIPFVSTRVPSSFTLFFPDRIVTATRSGGVWWSESVPHRLGRVPVRVLTYDPQLDRRFGRSRISREVRYLTDAAIRTLVRTETSAEFFSTPQRWLTGVSEDAFEDASTWSAIMGRILAIGLNEEGGEPSLGQFPQMSMDPHLSMYRQLAQNFCASVNLPMQAVGLFADNPASAEAMQAAEYALSDEAEYQWRVFTPELRRLVEDVVMIRDNTSVVPEDSWKLAVNWTPARYVSPQAASDFIVKISQALPEAANTTVGMRRAGFSQAEIEQMRTEMARNEAGTVLDRFLALSQAGPGLVEDA
jgi:hypothetical protein